MRTRTKAKTYTGQHADEIDEARYNREHVR